MLLLSLWLWTNWRRNLTFRAGRTAGSWFSVRVITLCGWTFRRVTSDITSLTNTRPTTISWAKLVSILIIQTFIGTGYNSEIIMIEAVGPGNVQSCLLIFFQYQPISLQYSLRSVEQSIRFRTSVVYASLGISNTIEDNSLLFIFYYYYRR